MLCLDFSCRTVFILSEALDEQLKALWFSPFQTDDIETDLDMVSLKLVQDLKGRFESLVEMIQI